MNILRDTSPECNPYLNIKSTAGPAIPCRRNLALRQRLKLMCDGKITILPDEGGGTVVTVTIPDGAGRNKVLQAF